MTNRLHGSVEVAEVDCLWPREAGAAGLRSVTGAVGREGTARPPSRPEERPWSLVWGLCAPLPGA
ncbi:hypothetical protein [Streptomyces smyrnaeus]|uniref:hypothetical protein n=1 Tax=Streptomyces smyrnaeus TaxID=1387713 RepID=UPI0033F484B9